MAEPTPSSGEKTEQATPRRLEQARRRGDVAVSRDLVAAAAFLAASVALTSTASSAVGGLVRYLRVALLDATRGVVAPAPVWLAFEAGVRVVALPLLAALVVAVLVGALQTKGLFAPAALQIDPSRVLPAWSRIAGRRVVAEMVKGGVKVAVLVVVLVATARHVARPLLGLSHARDVTVLRMTGMALDALAWRLGLAALCLGGLDYLWQRWQHGRQLRMTRDEVRRDHKESEGDPRHKAERQRLHQELLEQRMVESVRKADFIVVNPDHIAVALQYDRDGGGAPVVVAKGDRLLAERIKQVAREAGVPIFRDVGLARALREVREGDEIPEALYEAIAEILRVVYGEAKEPQPAPPAGSAGWRRG